MSERRPSFSSRAAWVGPVERRVQIITEAEAFARAEAGGERLETTGVPRQVRAVGGRSGSSLERLQQVEQRVEDVQYHIRSLPPQRF